MNRLEYAKARILAIRQACRENKDVPISQEALGILKSVIDNDHMRIYQLAEELVTEMYHSNCNELEAAQICADNWVQVVKWTISITGKPMIPLSETGMYP